MCGVGPGSATLYSGHSLKRGSFQLYRSFGRRDEQMIEIIQMIGKLHTQNYCAEYNDCAPTDLLRFSNLYDFLDHEARLVAESGDTVEEADKNSEV